ncbi:MAG: (2Fe-2S)-binding protein [Phototrophicaceae bacterium]
MELTINGDVYEVDIPDNMNLVWVIRDSIGLTGTKFGCGIGICGSCTVHVDGVPTRSCVTPAQTTTGKEITTIEGLATIDDEGNETLHPIQQAFIDKQVPQCSWCMSGQMMTAAAFIEDNTSPSEDDIINAMSANYCRCGCYVRIKDAVALAAETMGDNA